MSRVENSPAIIMVDWKVNLIDTGLNSMTGERIRRIRNYIDDKFLLTYGDGLSNINIHIKLSLILLLDFN